MHFSLFICVALFAALGLALPGGELAKRDSPCKKRGTCSHDNCLRAVIASSAKPGSASASNDCVSFFQKTVTHCASTSTATISMTVTGHPVMVTSSVLDIYTLPVETDTVKEHVITATSLATRIVSQPTTIVVTETLIESNYFKRAAATTKPAGTMANTTISVCPASTASPSLVPTYASACSGTARYSSACSCIGVTQATTTVAASTVTVTSIALITQTPTVTHTAFSFSVDLLTVVETDTVYGQLDTTVATIVEHIPTTVIATETVVETVQPPACTQFLAYVSSDGLYSGSYLQGGGEQVNLVFVGSSAASVFEISNGLVTQVSNGLRWSVMYTSGLAQIVTTDASDDDTYFDLSCSINSDTDAMYCTAQSPYGISNAFWTEDGAGSIFLGNYFNGNDAPFEVIEVSIVPHC